MNSPTPMVIQTSCWRAKWVPRARSMRWMTASPRPLSAATIGSSTGSAYGATIRTVTWAAMIRAASQPP